MAALVKTGKYGSINTIDTTIMGYFVIKFMSEAYTLQEDTTCDGKICSSDDLAVKYQHMNFIQYNMKCYW